MPAQVALASDLDKIIIGVGGAILLKDALDKEQKKARKSPSAKAKPAASGPMAKNKALPRQTQRAVQENLNAMGFDAGRPDGVWGPRTQRAFVAFENNTDGAVRDGVADVDEIALLAALSGGSDEGAVASATTVAAVPVTTAPAAPAPASNGGALPAGMSGSDGAVAVAQTAAPAEPVGPLAAELVPLLPEVPQGAPFEMSYAHFGLGVYEGPGTYEDALGTRLVVSRKGAYLALNDLRGSTCVYQIGKTSVDGLFFLKATSRCGSDRIWASITLGTDGKVTVTSPADVFPGLVLRPVHVIRLPRKAPDLKITGVAVNDKHDAVLAALQGKGGTSKLTDFSAGGFKHAHDIRLITGDWQDANFRYVNNTVFPSGGLVDGEYPAVGVFSAIIPLGQGNAPFQEDIDKWLIGTFGKPTTKGTYGVDDYDFNWLYRDGSLIAEGTLDVIKRRDGSDFHSNCGGRGGMDLRTFKDQHGQVHGASFARGDWRRVSHTFRSCDYVVTARIQVGNSGQINHVSINFSDLYLLAMMHEVHEKEKRFAGIEGIEVPARTPHGQSGSALPSMD